MDAQAVRGSLRLPPVARTPRCQARRPEHDAPGIGVAGTVGRRYGPWRAAGRPQHAVFEVCPGRRELSRRNHADRRQRGDPLDLVQPACAPAHFPSDVPYTRDAGSPAGARDAAFRLPGQRPRRSAFGDVRAHTPFARQASFGFRMNAHAPPPFVAAGTVPGGPALRADSLGKVYGAITVLADISLELKAGEVHAVIGENGAGKSTLMKLLSGHAAPTTGQLFMDGQAVAFPDAVAAEQAGIVLIHQEILLAPDLTVAQNLFLGREVVRGLSVDDRHMNQRAAQLLARVGSAARPRDRVGQLPLAQRQLVQIARALLDERKLVIFDEPTAVLAHDEVSALLDIVRSLRHQGVAVLYISHRLDEVQAVADTVTVLRDGRLVGTWPAAGMSQRQMAELMVGRSLDMLYPPRRQVPCAPPILSVTGLEVDGGLRAASFCVRPGEVLGLAGMVGAGRTELMEGLMGLRPSRAQRVELNGREVPLRSVSTMMDAGLVYLTEDRKGKGLLLNERL